MKRRKPWYSRVGPVSWYHHEWVNLELSFGKWLLLHLHYKPHRLLTIMVGGTINRRSNYGGGCDFTPLWERVLRIGK